jgi:hypothetical protein
MVNRETVRDAMATLLETALVGTGLPVQAVYNYRPGDFGGQSPVVVVSSSGSERPRFTAAGGRTTVFLQVDAFVLYSDEDTWGEDEAEDRIDLIETTIAETVHANQYTTNWEAADYAARSERIDVEIGGLEYVREMIPLRVEVYG